MKQRIDCGPTAPGRSCFFELQQIDMALIGIVSLLCSIISNTIMFWGIARLAGRLFVPYAA